MTERQWVAVFNGHYFDIKVDGVHSIAGVHHNKFIGEDGNDAEADAHIIAAAPDMLEALEKVNEFIANGIEYGYITMPDVDCPDPAHEVPALVQVAINKAKRGET